LKLCSFLSSFYYTKKRDGFLLKSGERTRKGRKLAIAQLQSFAAVLYYRSNEHSISLDQRHAHSSRRYGDVAGGILPACLPIRHFGQATGNGFDGEKATVTE
jgi:hypothetical protein